MITIQILRMEKTKDERKKIKVLKVKRAKEQHLGFERGPPPYYQPGPTVLNFAEQTGSGAVTVVWSFLQVGAKFKYIKSCFCLCYPTTRQEMADTVITASLKLVDC